MPYFFCFCFILEISQEKAVWYCLGGGNADLSDLIGPALGAVRLQNVDVILRAWLSHGAGPGLGALQCSDEERGLCLTEALLDGKTGGLQEPPVDLRVQGFAGSRYICKTGQIIMRQIHVHQEPIYGGRCAEGFDLVLFDHI